MQLLKAVNQTMVPVQAFQLHTGRGESIKAHTAIHRTQHRIHARIAIHAAEVVRVVGHF